MLSTLSPSLRGLQAAAIAVLLACAGLNGPAAHAQNAVVVVNGDPVTNFDIDQRIKLLQLSGGKAPSRQEAMEELINDRVKIKEGKKFAVDLSKNDLETQYAAMATRMRLTADQLDKVLEGRGIRPDTLKARLRADYIWAQLVRGRYGQNLLVGEKDIASAIEVKGGEGKEQTGSFEYKMRPVVLFVPRGAPPSAIELRKKDAETLRGRVQSCEQAEGVFRAMRDGVIRDQVAKTSADLPAPLREILDKTPVGQMTPPEVTRQGVEMVALCSRAPSTETPEKREAREKLFTQKYEAQAKKYLQDARRSSMIEYR
jgi:peptidyl-prolyl cis-trans isomerase SurA